MKKPILLLLLSFVLSFGDVDFKYYFTSEQTISHITKSLSNQLIKDTEIFKSHTVVMTKMKDLENLDNSLKVREILNASLMHELNVLGVNLASSTNLKSDFVLQSTYIQLKDGAMINSIISQMPQSNIISTAMIFIPKEFIKKIENPKMIHRY